LNTLSFKTKYQKAEEVTKNWLVVDASNRTLGRFSSKVASLIRGKHKPGYTPNVDCGDHVIIINAEKIRLTGKKWDDKEYVSYSGYPGGQKRLTPRQVRTKSPSRLLEMSVKGMLPKTRLGRQMFKNLHVYAGGEHPHNAQNPKLIDLK
jgi:large subunit ribosomal protein L13